MAHAARRLPVESLATIDHTTRARLESTTALGDLGGRKGPDVDAVGMPTITPAPPAWLLREVHGHSLHHSAVRPDRSSEIQTPDGHLPESRTPVRGQNT